MRGNGSSERSKRESHHTETKDFKRDAGRRPGELSIVSLGPGSASYLVPEAMNALDSAQVLVGYKMYLGLISTELSGGKKIISSGMRKEMERCQAAIDHAMKGYRVALVSSGDAGIYGMAGLVFDLCREQGLKIATEQEEDDSSVDLHVRVIPGVAAFNAAASLLGAPLMHDFAVISLSDHLTSWDLIEKRLAAAASADFVIAIYNPRSKARPKLLEEAQKILLRFLPSGTPVAIVRRAMREDEWKCVTTLGSLPFEEVDMQSVLLVGNSKTYHWDGWMVTPRGYLEKYSR